MTEWRAIPGFRFYEASSDGQVRSIDHEARTNRGGLFIRPGRVLKAVVKRNRRSVSLHQDGVTSTRFVHVLVTMAFYGPRPDGMYSCHNDGDSLNDRADNLRWDSAAANQMDMVAHGNHRNARKTKCKRGHALTPDNVRFKRSDRGSGVQRSCLECERMRDRARTPRGRGEAS